MAIDDKTCINVPEAENLILEDSYFFLSLLAIFLTICWAWDHTRGHTNHFAEKNRYERAHTVLYFKNGSQIEIFSFLQLLIKMLNYSILDHIYIYKYICCVNC